jgi:hypothetical protein
MRIADMEEYERDRVKTELNLTHKKEILEEQIELLKTVISLCHLGHKFKVNDYRKCVECNTTYREMTYNKAPILTCNEHLIKGLLE